MTPDVVVDIGNSRMKWGRVSDGRVGETVSLPLDAREVWTEQRRAWGLEPPAGWVVASVNPVASARFVGWLAGDSSVEIRDFRQVPLRLVVRAPEQVGIDRLLTGLAAHKAVRRRPVVVFNVGTALTADVVDADGTFLGGAILPGPQLMARALHDHTAKLPLIDAGNIHTVCVPGADTKSAIEAGILAATGGAIRWLIDAYTDRLESPPVVYFTGGGAKPYLDTDGNAWTPDPTDTRYAPALTLEGIRLAAEAMP